MKEWTNRSCGHWNGCDCRVTWSSSSLALSQQCWQRSRPGGSEITPFGVMRITCRHQNLSRASKN